MILVVDGQRIYNYEYQEPQPIATNSLGFIDIEFRLSEEWEGYICTAQFVQHKENGTDFIASKVLYNNHVTFPDGIIPGVLEISLFGYKAGEAERGTTFPYIQPVYRSGFTSTEATPIPPTPDLYSQFLESFETTKQSIENDKQLVQNASKDAITARDSAVKAAESAKSSEQNAIKTLEAIETAGETQISNVQSEGVTQISSVKNAGNEQSRALSAQGDVEQRKVIAAGDEQVSRVTNAGNDAVESVTLEKTNAVNSVQSTKVEAVNSVETAKTSAVDAVKSAESTAIQNIGTGVDDTLSISGKAADAKKTGDSISSLKDDLAEQSSRIIVTGNLYNHDTISVGKYITAGGNSGNNDNYNLTDFIHVNPEKGTIYSYLVKDDKTHITLKSMRYFVFFDKNKKYISGIENTNKANIPENAISVRITIPASYDYKNIYIGYDANTENPRFSIYEERLKYGHIPFKSVFDITIPYISYGNGRQIKLLGDSITHGAGGTGFAQDGDTIATYGDTTWRVNTSGYCWANLLKNYMEQKFGCVVKNYGCSGITAYKLNLIMDQVVEDSDDLIVLMIGTNDRRNTNTLGKLKIALTSIIDYVRSKNKEIILMSSIPASVSNETSGITYFHMEDVDNLYAEIAYELNVEYISMFKEILNYITNRGVSYDDILSGGLHPNDVGHELMFRIICSHFGFAPKINGATW